MRSSTTMNIIWRYHSRVRTYGFQEWYRCIKVQRKWHSDVLYSLLLNPFGSFHSYSYPSSELKKQELITSPIGKRNIIPYNIWSKLLFFIYSYTSSLWAPSEQQPRRRTKFLCCMLVISRTSARNSRSPCCDLSTDSFLTAINCPSPSFP